MSYQDLTQLAKDLGFTPDKIFPLLVLFGLGVLYLSHRLKPTEKKIGNIESYFIRLGSVLQTGGDISKMELYTNKSPLTINPKGYEVLEITKFKRGIDDNIGLLTKVIDNLKPNSALDVEQTSIGVIRFVMSDKDVKIFKESEDYLYQNPKYNNPEVFNLAGLYLRDKYLETHKELIPQNENKQG